MPTTEAVETLERGTIAFFYRPRVEEHEPRSVADLQRLYVLLAPRDRGKLRLIVIGRKVLPEPKARGHQRFWGFVEAVAAKPEAMADALKAQVYETKTRGTRHLPAARPAASGAYRLLRHGDHVHLAYALARPERPGEVQRALHLEHEASYILAVANPQRPPRPGVPRSKDVHLPKRLLAKFRGRAFIDAEPDFLDHEGADLLWIAASEDVRRELGVDLDPEGQKDVFEVLRLDGRDHPLLPLLEGRWD
jgi:hypothetical protein